MTYTITEYGGMIADQGRLQAYHGALESKVTAGSTVLDIGTGTGVMALLACRAGASRVYAIEPASAIDLARSLAAANGCGDRIRFIRDVSTSVALPEPVDVVVSDLRGTLPLNGGSVASLLDARNRFLAPGGTVIAESDSLWIALVGGRVHHDHVTKRWESLPGFDFSAARARSLSTFHRTRFDAADLCVDPASFAVLDYARLEGPDVSGEARWTISAAGEACGLAIWFDCRTAPGFGFSNSPRSAERHVYKQAFFPWPEPVMFSAGDEVRVRASARFVQTDYVWSWCTEIASAGSQAHREFRQSSLADAVTSVERLRRRDSRFVPATRPDARIDRRILELMDGRLTLGEMADRLIVEFPESFSSRDGALTRAGDIAERYT